MSEVTSQPNPLFLRDEELRRGIELLFFAYRDFISDPDAILRDYGFGRAHHRALHFIGRNPAITVSELLDILKITKQSLSRVLSQLIESGYVRQEKGAQDRRQRLLFLTDAGHDLETALSTPQRARVARAYREAGGEAVAGFMKVLIGLLDAGERGPVIAKVNKPS